MNSPSKRLHAEGLETRLLMAADVAYIDMPADVGHDNELACVASNVAGNVPSDLVIPQVAFQSNNTAAASAHVAEAAFPDEISLPVGFEPEGITNGRGHDFFAGGFSFSSFLGPLAGQNHPVSTYAGAIYKGDLRTGEGEILIAPTGRPVAGLSYDARTDYLYAGVGDPLPIGGSRTNFGVVVYNGTTGEKVDEIIFGDDIGVNDVLVTQSAVYATDSSQPVIYRIPLMNGGELRSSPIFEVIQLTGDGVGARNNGLVGTPQGDTLVVINDATGVLHRVDTESGVATPIAIHGDEGLFVNGDGLYMSGRTLYIMQNFANKIAVVQLSGDLTEGTFVKNIVSEEFRTPTTILGFGDSVYAVNSHVLFDPLSGEDVIFETPGTVQTELVRVHK